MRTNLKLALALLCGVGLGAAATHGLRAAPEITRNVLQHADLTGTTTTEVYMTLIEAPPGSAFAPHVHHGDEFTYVMEGALDLDIAGQGTKSVKAGDTIPWRQGRERDAAEAARGAHRRQGQAARRPREVRRTRAAAMCGRRRSRFPEEPCTPL